MNLSINYCNAPEKRVGYIYLIEIVPIGLYKIGLSVNPHSRRDTICLPEGIHGKRNIVHAIPCNDMYICEKYFHRRYKAYQYKHYAEWFRLPSDVVKEFCAITSMSVDGYHVNADLTR